MKISRTKIARYLRLRREGVTSHTAVKQVRGGRYSVFMCALRAAKVKIPVKVIKKPVVRRPLPKLTKKALEKRIRKAIAKKKKAKKVLQVKKRKIDLLILPIGDGYCIFPNITRNTKEFKAWMEEKKLIKELRRAGRSEDELYPNMMILDMYELKLKEQAKECFVDTERYNEFTEKARWYH